MCLRPMKFTIRPMFSALKLTLTICLFSFSFPGSYGLQRFAEQPKYTEVNPGEDALLSCKIIDKRGSCSWQKDNKVRSTKSVYLYNRM